MEVNLILPDWVVDEKRAVYIMAGIELVAYKMPDEKWLIKTGRCSMCGKCCQGFGEDTSELCSMVESGDCKYLISDGDKRVCSLGSSRPWSCSVAVFTNTIKECTEKFE